jgi:hypothetical protein
MYKKQLQLMELYIKTLTGVSLEVVVSPSDKVYDVKYRIQKREGWIINCKYSLLRAFHFGCLTGWVFNLPKLEMGLQHMHFYEK